jgi:DNA-binding IclR family transcriptional regulator
VHETITLVVRVGWFGLRIEVIGDTAQFFDITGSGALTPLCQTLEGRGILAFLSDAEIREYRRSLQSGTLGAVKSRQGLSNELSEAKERGYVAAPLRFADNLAAISLPVRTSSGIAVAAIGILGPVLSLASRRTPPQVKSLLDIRDQLERALQDRTELAINPFSHWSSQSPPREKGRRRSAAADFQMTETT